MCTSASLCEAFVLAADGCTTVQVGFLATALRESKARHTRMRNFDLKARSVCIA